MVLATQSVQSHGILRTLDDISTTTLVVMVAAIVLGAIAFWKALDWLFEVDPNYLEQITKISVFFSDVLRGDPENPDVPVDHRLIRDNEIDADFEDLFNQDPRFRTVYLQDSNFKEACSQYPQFGQKILKNARFRGNILHYARYRSQILARLSNGKGA